MVPVKPAGDGVYRVEVDGRFETVYVAGSADDAWAFWNGRVYRGDFRNEAAPAPRRADRTGTRQALSAPMPSTVIAVRVKAGDQVRSGDTVILLEAMKMELPIRAPSDGVVAAVHCREGELVQADVPLLELE